MRNRHIGAKSLIGICIRSLIIYTLILILIFLGAGEITDRLWGHMLPEAQRILDREEEIAEDRYEQIPERLYRGCAFLVYDEKGELLYSSNQELAGLITAEETDFVQDTDEEMSVSYSVVREENGGTWVLAQSYSQESNSLQVASYCRLNENHEIIEGSLFAEKGFLSEKELCLLERSLPEQCYLERYELTNDKGESRTLIFQGRYLTEETLGQINHRQGIMIGFAFAVGTLGMIIMAFVIARKIRRAMEPLNTAMEDYAETGQFHEEGLVIPNEISDVMDTMRAMALNLEEAEAARRREAEEKNRMITNLSHDLKTPLTVIQGYAQALGSRTMTEEQRDNFLEVLLRKADQSVRMINELVKYASMEHPDFTPKPEERDICEFCRECLAEQYQEIENAGMELDVDIPERPIRYPLDSQLFASVIENLLGNILQYNPSGTRILFTLERRRDEIRICVADDGVGVPEEIRTDFFKPFVTGDKARTSPRGTGIGMSIVRRAVELHGGHIELAEASGSRYSTIIEMHFPTKANFV